MPRMCALRAVLFLACLGVITPAVRAQSGLEVEDLAGCYDVEIRGLDPARADSIYYRPPPRVVLSVDRKAEGLGAGSLIIRVPPGSVPSPHEAAFWSLQDSTVRMTWTTGYIGISATLMVMPGGLNGEYHRFTDVVRGTRGPRGVLTARRVACSEPTPYVIAEMARYFQPIVLGGDSRLELKETIPPGVVMSSTRAPRIFTLDAETKGPLRGAERIRVRLDDRGLIERISLSYDISELERVRSQLVEIFGPWHSDSEFYQSHEWVWQGRAESIYLIDREGRAVGLSFSAR